MRRTLGTTDKQGSFAQRLAEALIAKYKETSISPAMACSNCSQTCRIPKGRLVRISEDVVSRHRQKIVDSAEEEAAAVAEGWSRQPPIADPNYPKTFVEVQHLCGRGSGYRKILVHNGDEERQWRELVDTSQWAGDAQHELGGRPTSVGDFATVMYSGSIPVSPVIPYTGESDTIRERLLVRVRPTGANVGGSHAKPETEQSRTAN
jgi:hypothetical protein